MRNKILTLIGACVIVFSVAAGVTQVRAGVADNVTGWIYGWSDDGNVTGQGVIKSGLGWISMNSTNCDTDSNGINNACDMNGDGVINATDFVAVSNYGVKIPVNGDDWVTGYAWSSNVGYIDFAPHSVCGKYAGACAAYPSGAFADTIPKQDVRRTGDNLIGWARVVDIAKANAVGNAGGWDGWIMFGGNPGGASADNARIMPTGYLTGYAWAGELGYIHLANYNAMIPPPPTVDLEPDLPVLINIKTAIFPKTETLTWTSTNTSNCDFDSTPNHIQKEIGAGATGSKTITVPSTGMDELFTITCQSNSGYLPVTDFVRISTVCYPQVCASQTCGDDILSSGTRFGVADTAQCAFGVNSYTTCSADSDCVMRSPGEWIEIAP